MADPLLTSLCSVCHVAPPRYKCPRCRARTCSSTCIKRHKARSSCTGIRDPTAFVPPSKLRTPAGIDHDYNFISSIERARERAEKVIVEGKALVREEELRPQNEDRHYEKVWHGDDLRHKLRDNKKGGRFQEDDTPASQFERHIRRRLRALDVDVLRMPAGMSRQQENRTTWNRLRRVVNWQIEWLVFAHNGTEERPPLRILHKALDTKPLNQALAESLEYHRTWQQKQEREREQGDEPLAKRRKTSQRRVGTMQGYTQDSASSCWRSDISIGQDPHSTGWSRTSETAAFPAIPEDEYAELQNHRFFLLRPGAASRQSKILVPLPPTDTLELALSGRTVLEFPTVYVLPPSGELPPEFAVGSQERRERKPEEADGKEGERGPFRKGRFADRNQRHRGQRGARMERGRGRRVAFAVPTSNDLEDGEIKSDEERPADMHVNHESSNSDESSGDETPEEVANKPVKGLVDYDSTSSSSAETDSEENLFNGPDAEGKSEAVE